MKKILKSLIIILIIVLILICIILVVIKDKKEKTTNIGNISSLGTFNFNKQNYWDAESIFNNYLSYVKMLDTDINNLNVITSEEKKEEEILAEYKEYAMNAIYEMIDTQYIKEKNTSKEQIYLKLQPFSSEQININSIKLIGLSEDLYIAIIYGKTKTSLKEFNTIIKIDASNELFSIYLDDYVENLSNNEEILAQKISKDKLQEKEYNNYNIEIITDKTTVIYYFNNYKWNALEYPEFAYELLDSKYRKLKFGNINNFKNYLNAQENLKDANIDSYTVSQYGNYTEYNAVDQYNNQYIFNELKPMQYTVLLDDYTVSTEEFKNRYNSANEFGKISLNLDKFIRAINDKSYYYIYNYLISKEFRESNFKSLEEFEDYINKNLFNNNAINYEEAEISKESDLYIFKVKIFDTDNNDNAIEKTIIMKLNDGTNFEMSFDI